MALSGALGAATWRGDALLARLAKATWRFAVLRIQPQIVLTDLGYDSNLYHQKEAVEDFTFTLGPQINAFLPIKNRIIATVSESPRYVYFYETARERTWNNYLDADVNVLLKRFFISAGTFWNDVRERVNYEIDFRPRFKMTGARFVFHWQPREKTSFSAVYRLSDFHHERDAPETVSLGTRLDRREAYLSVSAFMQWTAKTRFFIEYERGDVDFIAADNPRDGRSDAVYSGFEFSESGRIRGTLRLGYKSHDSRSPGMADFRGLVGDSSLEITLARPLVVRGSYLRDVRPSTWTTNPFFVESQWGLGASFYFPGRRFRLDLDRSETRFDYPEGPAPETGADAAGPLVRRRDAITITTIGLMVRLGGDTGLGLEAGRYNRKSNVFGWNIDRNFVRMSLSYEF